MERLTRTEYGEEQLLLACDNCIRGLGVDNPPCATCDYENAALERLSAYENTGLTPEEITRLTAERDEAVADINKLLQQPGFYAMCWACKFYDGKPGCDKYNSNGDCCESAEWRGTQPETAADNK